MRGLKQRKYNYLVCQVVIGLTVWTNCADGSCSKTAKKLWAYPNPSTETFVDSYKRFMSSDRGERCTWVITTSDQDSYVKLSFPTFQLKNSTKSDKGDCLEIHNGDDDKLDVLCDQAPKDMYVSSDKEIQVIYRRGEVEGERRFSMTYSSHSVMSKEKLIQIAGIVGAVLAGIGLTYFVLRVTKCFKCLRKKNTDSCENTERERDRLMRNTLQSRENTENSGLPQTQPSGSSSSSPQNNQNGVTVPDANITVDDHPHDSDIDSLHEMNELPPSYESLYLNEQGEPVTPPKYSLPEHISTHPPRRVNTVN